MVIYIEGIDGSGKTTLYNRLHCAYIDEPGVYFDKTVYANKCNDRLESQEYEKRLWHQRCDNKNIYIYDRSPVSDFAYRMWDNKMGHYNLDDEFAGGGISVIHCQTSCVATSFNNCTETDKDDVRNINDFIDVDKAYASLLDIIQRWYKIPVIDYNYEIDSNDSEWDKICQFINNILEKCHEANRGGNINNSR